MLSLALPSASASAFFLAGDSWKQEKIGSFVIHIFSFSCNYATKSRYACVGVIVDVYVRVCYNIKFTAMVSLTKHSGKKL